MASTSEPIQPPGFINTFQSFPKLPPELRLIVWKFAVNAPRIVTLQQIPYPGQPVAYNTTKPPGMLYANTESRSVALEVYESVVISRVVGEPIHYNPHTDILFFDFNCFAIAFILTEAYNDNSITEAKGGKSTNPRFTTIAVASHACPFQVGFNQVSVVLRARFLFPNLTMVFFETNAAGDPSPWNMGPMWEDFWLDRLEVNIVSWTRKNSAS